MVFKMQIIRRTLKRLEYRFQRIQRRREKDAANPTELYSYALNAFLGNDSNLLIVFYVQIMPDDFVMQLHRF